MNSNTISMLDSDTIPALEQIAAKMKTSSRALRRRLPLCCSSYQQVLQQSKLLLALNLLGNSDLNLTQISKLFGFGETRNFSSSFKRWQGWSPLEYRKQTKKPANQAGFFIAE